MSNDLSNQTLKETVDLIQAFMAEYPECYPYQEDTQSDYIEIRRWKNNQGIRRLVINRDGYNCRYCGCSLKSEEIEFDHVTPKSRGGKNNLENIVVSCCRCNSKKSNYLLEELGWKLLQPTGR